MLLQKNEVILVNEQDEAVGTMDKMEAHHEGALHRAFSVFILNEKGEMLLQQRAIDKYHSGGLWSNTCCSHPYPGEDTDAAAHRRLEEELGFDTALQPMFILRYKSDVGNGLTENEYDHIYIGNYSAPLAVNEEEVMDHKYASLGDIENWLQERPNDFTAWFRLAFPLFQNHLKDPIPGSLHAIAVDTIFN